MKNNFYFLLGFLMIFSACETESGSDEIYKVYIAYQGADKVGVR